MSIYYNPWTCSPQRVYRIDNTRVVDKNDPDYTDYWLDAYLSKDALISSDRSGALSWIVNGVLYAAECTATWDYIPLHSEAVCVINATCGDAYCISKEAAEKWVERFQFRNDGIVYQEEFDVYTIHYYIDPL